MSASGARVAPGAPSAFLPPPHVLLLCYPSALITVWKLPEQRLFQHWQHSEDLMAGSPGKALSKSSLSSKINGRDEGHGQICGLFPAPLSFG